MHQSNGAALFKTLGSILLLLFIAFQAMHLPILTLWLNLNQEYIADNLCENRFEPELMCSGRCYVNEQTEIAIGNNDQSNQATATLLDWHENLSPFLLVRPIFPTHLDSNFSINGFTDVNTYQFTFINNIFHPPRLG